MLRQSPRTFVERLDFRTTVGHGDGPGSRERLGLRRRGATAVVTDLGVLEPDPATGELTLTELHPGVTATTRARRRVGSCALADDVHAVDAPTAAELEALRALKPRRRRVPTMTHETQILRTAEDAALVDGGAQPLYYPDYRSTRCARRGGRSCSLPEDAARATGPVFGDGRGRRSSTPTSRASTTGEPLGERIVVTGAC